MKTSVRQSYQNILKISSHLKQSKTTNSPLNQKKRVKSATLLKQQPYEKLINNTTRDEETTRGIIDSIRVDNDCKQQNEDDQFKKIENYKYQHEKDQCYITHLQQQVKDLEQQLVQIETKQKSIIQPIKNNAKILMDRISYLEIAKTQYSVEEDKLQQCLQQILDQNYKINLAYEKKCLEIQKLKTLKQIPLKSQQF
ncbi:unnamed protein product [Paramecium sonneborni]|uniref:Uncharacterized protein n=1 Tax=Paramecium sonneborni TaxID=65129 RepID=A0A8S1QS99_9CILI|nr:unnamed protein product [Paramecium sonneborni]